MNQEEVIQVLKDHAGLLGQYDDLAKQVFNHLDQLHVDLVQLETVWKEIHRLKPEEVRVLLSGVTVAIPGVPTIYGNIASVRKSILAANGTEALEAAGLTVHDWERERSGQLEIARE